MIAIRLNKNVDSQYVLQKIQQEINQYISNHEIDSGLLHIEIKTVVDQENDFMPKLENKIKENA
jgi:hypothetical protein